MINVSSTAASKINELLSEEGKAGSGLRVFVHRAGLLGISSRPDDRGKRRRRRSGLRIKRREALCRSVSISYLKGAEVDFVETVTGGGFTIRNPNAVSTGGCGQSFNV